jgi:hypothetical protein
MVFALGNVLAATTMESMKLDAMRITATTTTTLAT